MPDGPGGVGAVGAIAIVPARLESTRFPRKVLASETGLPLVVHAARAAAQASSISRVVIAADSPEIIDAVTPHGVEAVLTSVDHENGTSRLGEAARILGLAPEAIVVNVQGDEPEIEPGLIDAAVERLVADESCPVATAASPISERAEIDNPNVVKVVTDARGRALYFSRAPIPFDRDAGGRGSGALRHIGLYAYRVWFLHRYRDLEPTALERTERLEQLRVLEHGHDIGVAIVPGSSRPGIDTPEQYAAFVARFVADRA